MWFDEINIHKRPNVEGKIDYRSTYGVQQGERLYRIVNIKEPDMENVKHSNENTHGLM